MGTATHPPPRASRQVGRRLNGAPAQFRGVALPLEAAARDCTEGGAWLSPEDSRATQRKGHRESALWARELQAFDVLAEISGPRSARGCALGGRE